MKGKLRNRNETAYVDVTLKNMHEASFDELVKEAKRKGFLFFPYHVFIDSDANVHEGRPMDAVACIDLTEGNEDVLTILVDAPVEHLVTDAQRKALQAIVSTYAPVEVKGVRWNENISLSI